MISTAVTWMNRVLRWLSGVLLAGILVLILLQIGLRSLVGRGLAWSNELATYFLVWAVCLGLAVAFFERTHLTAEALVSRLGRLRRPVEAVALVLTIFFLCILVYYGWSMVESGMSRTSPALEIPMGYIYLALPVAGVIGILNILAVMVTGKEPEQRADEVDDGELALTEEGVVKSQKDADLGGPQDKAAEASTDDPDDQRKGRTS